MSGRWAPVDQAKLREAVMRLDAGERAVDLVKEYGFSSYTLYTARLKLHGKQPQRTGKKRRKKKDVEAAVRITPGATKKAKAKASKPDKRVGRELYFAVKEASEAAERLLRTGKIKTFDEAHLLIMLAYRSVEQ